MSCAISLGEELGRLHNTYTYMYVQMQCTCIYIYMTVHVHTYTCTCTTELDTTISYLDVSIGTCIRAGQIHNDKRDNFNFNIVNYPYMCSNIPTKPTCTYGVYISQLIRISRICDKFASFAKRHRLLTDRLIQQGFWYSKLCSSFRKFTRRHRAEICKYRVSMRTHVVEGIHV